MIFVSRRGITTDTKAVERIFIVCNIVAPVLALASIFLTKTHHWELAGWLLATSAWLGITGFYLKFVATAAVTEQHQERITELEKRAIAEPEKIAPAWDLGRARLQTYIDENINQVKAIFRVAVGVMVAGVPFIVWGLYEAIVAPDRIKVAAIGGAVGALSQFIGATLMVIYRNTMLQASQYISVLDHINRVGMAVQILDSMDDTYRHLKDQTRANIITLLLAASPSAVSLNLHSVEKESGEQSPTTGKAAKV